jgi:hypothetical protein
MKNYLTQMLSKPKAIAILIIGLTSCYSYSIPCQRYFIKGYASNVTKIIRDDLVFMWSRNPNCTFNKKGTEGIKYIVTVGNLFDEVFLTDTTEASFYYLDKSLFVKSSELYFLFSFKELGEPETEASIALSIQNKQFPEASDKIDTLNNYLLNGFFFNSLAILKKLDNPALIDRVLKEYDLMFPMFYPYNFSREFFNCYMDKSTLSLVNMPYVDGLYEFYQYINKQRKKNSPVEALTIYAKISPDNRILKIEVIPSANEEIATKSLQLLHFDNQRGSVSDVVIKIGTNKRKTKYSIINERALLNPSSSKFQKTFVDNSAIH